MSSLQRTTSTSSADSEDDFFDACEDEGQLSRGSRTDSLNKLAEAAVVEEEEEASDVETQVVAGLAEEAESTAQSPRGSRDRGRGRNIPVHDDAATSAIRAAASTASATKAAAVGEAAAEETQEEGFIERDEDAEGTAKTEEQSAESTEAEAQGEGAGEDEAREDANATGAAAAAAAETPPSPPPRTEASLDGRGGSIEMPTPENLGTFSFPGGKTAERERGDDATAQTSGASVGEGGAGGESGVRQLGGMGADEEDPEGTFVIKDTDTGEFIKVRANSAGEIVPVTPKAVGKGAASASVGGSGGDRAQHILGAISAVQRQKEEREREAAAAAAAAAVAATSASANAGGGGNSKGGSDIAQTAQQAGRWLGKGFAALGKSIATGMAEAGAGIEKGMKAAAKAAGAAEKAGASNPYKHEACLETLEASAHRKDFMELTGLGLVQSLGGGGAAGVAKAHEGPIWTMAFNHNGTLLATAGQDTNVYVWRVVRRGGGGGGGGEGEEEKDRGKAAISEEQESAGDDTFHVFSSLPYRVYKGHSGDVIDLSWSKNDFLLSGSMDKSARLWHPKKEFECLCEFQHSDFVTAVDFHPTVDGYFLSGSFDRKLRIWNIPEGRVVQWVGVADMVTAACFSPDGKLAVAGLFNGQAVFYQADGLRYYTQVECRNRRGKSAKGRKVTGLHFVRTSAGGLTGHQHTKETTSSLLVTTNDSRARLIRMDDFSFTCKYKGLMNESMQIRASACGGGERVICGSEDGNVYVWRTMHDRYTPSAVEVGFQRNKNGSYEYFAAHDCICTCAQFAPEAAVLSARPDAATDGGAVPAARLIVTCAFDGEIRVFENVGREVKV